MSTDVLRVGFPGVWDVQAHWNALDAAVPRFTADEQWRICYTLPDGTDVLMSPSAGAVPIVRWLFPLSTPVPQQQVSGDAALRGIPYKTAVNGGLRARGTAPDGKRLHARS